MTSSQQPNERPVQAVIFDVDGTLIDSVDQHAHAWQDALAEFGKDVPFEDVRFQIGKGGDQFMPVFLSEEEIEEFGKDLGERRAEIFKEKYLPQIQKFPQTRELFQRVRESGKKIALASSAKADELEDYKKIADIEDLVQEQTSSDDAEKSKPFPDIFAAALDRLGNPPPEEVIVIGDTPYDIEAAGKIRLRTIAVRCGGFPEDTLKDAVAIYDDPADLLANYDASPLGAS
ncbi:MAG TPA: HAD family hydrolase [Chthoniobacterales bacterium]